MKEFSGRAAALEIRAALEDCHAQAAFGLPGGPSQILFQTLRSATTRLIVPTHELAAAFMAGSYGRVAGAPGVLLTMPGPGFAYALPGLAEAWLDSAPLVHIVGAPPEPPHQRLRHQALDQPRIARSLVKRIVRVNGVAEVREAMREAFAAAVSGEPGPVMLQLGGSSDAESMPAPAAPEVVAAASIWARIRAAHKPVFFLGAGCVASAATINAYIERTGTPLFTTTSGRGIVSEDSPWCLGYDTLRETTDQLNAFLQHADLIVAIGARLAHNGTAGFDIRMPPERLVHVDASAANLNALYPASEVAAFSAEAFFAMPDAARVPRTGWTATELGVWRAQIGTALAGTPEPRIVGASPREFFTLLRQSLPDAAILVTDSGLHQVMARRYFEVRHVHGLLLPTDLQAMGFGLPSAIAAKVAQPSRTVVALIGDGGLAMSGLELATAVREGLSLTAIVFNDGYLNQIRMQQLQHSGRSFGVKLPVMKLADLAAAVGARYVAGHSLTPQLLQKTAAAPGVSLIEVPVSDGLSVASAALVNFAKDTARRALGSRWHSLRRWLRR